MKIYCLDLPLESHAPFLIADSSLLPKGKPSFLPSEEERYAAHPAIVVKINRIGKSVEERFAHRYYSELAIGFSLREKAMLDALRREGAPWSGAVCFDGCAPVGSFVAKEELPEPAFRYRIGNGPEAEVRVGWRDIDRAVSLLSRRNTYKMGDLIFLCPPRPEREDLTVKINDRVEGAFLGRNSNEISFHIK